MTLIRCFVPEHDKIIAVVLTILTSLRAGVVVLNSDLQILIWNRKAEDLWGLRKDEVILQHFMNLDIGLPLEPLRKPLLGIIAGELDSYEEMMKARNRRGKTIQCHAICTPLTHMDLDIHGVILVMEESEINVS
jgi:two-component system, chemotaxis family, CheB/CheR fusion protein